MEIPIADLKFNGIKHEWVEGMSLIGNFGVVYNYPQLSPLAQTRESTPE